MQFMSRMATLILMDSAFFIPRLVNLDLAMGAVLTLAIRPEHFSLTNSTELSLAVKTDITEMHGDSTVVLFSSTEHGTLQMKVPYQLKLSVGEDVTIGASCEHILVFDEHGQAIHGES